MSRVGWDATVVLPRYRGITVGREIDRFPLRVGGYYTEVGLIEEPLADGARGYCLYGAAASAQCL